MQSRSHSRFFAPLLGASVTIAVSAVLGTASFNAQAWAIAGSGVSFAEAYSLVPRNLLYLPL